jgi:hypothetical protein
MNPEIKQKWVDALRSGEYQQGRNSLRNGNGFCCLGVLCDLYSKENNKSWTRYDADQEVYVPFDELRDKVEDLYDYLHMDGEPELLPQSVMNWAGLDIGSPEVEVNDEPDGFGSLTRELADLNDNRETFATIADLIEKSL